VCGGGDAARVTCPRGGGTPRDMQRPAWRAGRMPPPPGRPGPRPATQAHCPAGGLGVRKELQNCGKCSSINEPSSRGADSPRALSWDQWPRRRGMGRARDSGQRVWACTPARRTASRMPYARARHRVLPPCTGVGIFLMPPLHGPRLSQPERCCGVRPRHTPSSTRGF
jgi:hypothetical protein